MLGRCIVDPCLEDVLTCFSFEHALHVLLVNRELLRKFVRFTEDVDRLLEVLCDKSNAICPSLVDDTTVGQNSLATYKHTVNHRHGDRHCCVIDLLALDAHLVTLFLHDGACARRHALCCDDLDVKAAFTGTLDHVEYDA